MHVHYDHRAARVRAEGALLQRALGCPLEIQVNGQHHVAAGLGRAPNVFGLPVAGVVDQYRFGAGSAAQLFITAILDAEDATVIREIERKEGLLAFLGIVVAPQMAKDVCRRGPIGIGAR